MEDFFISYTKPDQNWAEWLAWQLEAAGYQTTLDLWDFRPGSNLVLNMDRAAKQAKRILVVLSPDYLAALHTQPEWAAAFVRDPLGEQGVLLPVKVRACQAGGLLRPLVLIDLVYLDEAQASETLVKGVSDSRMKPQKKPAYPGKVSPSPAFPGDGRRIYFEDEEVRELSEALDLLYRRKEVMLIAGEDVSAVQRDILNLRRRIREGGQLKAGDFLQEGRFQLIQSIGRGGFATVWKAFDRRGQNIVAVKVLHVDLAHDRTRCERFFRGARKMADVHHQGVVRVIEREIDDGGYRAFVMEYVEGGDFREAVIAGKLSIEQRIEIVLEVGAALIFAHGMDIIHRDVKPANILLTKYLKPKLTDFDLVRAFDTTGGTRTGMMGTFMYAAPESMERGQEAGKAADVYGLGMTLLFALNGQDLTPETFRNPSPLIQRLSISRQAKVVLLRAISWDPSRRFQRIADFCAAMEALKTSPRLGLTRFAPLPTDTDIEPRYRFDNFIVGRSNELAYAAAKAVAERPFVAYNPLLIWGYTGVGKTHLLHAISHEVSRLHPHLQVAYLTAEQFVNEMITSIRSDRTAEFRNRYRTVDFLILDELEFIAGKERTQEEFYHLLNSLLKNGQLVMAAGCPLRSMNLEARIHRRIELGLVVDLVLPEDETKVGILQLKSRSYGLDSLRYDVTKFIASRCRTSSELEGVLNRLIAISSLAGEPISIDFAEQAVEGFLPGPRRAEIGELIKAVARHYNLKVSDIKSKTNSRQIAFPRQVAMYLCKRLTDLSYAEIGKNFNDKHYSTVMYAVEKIGHDRRSDPDLDRILADFEDRFME